METTNPPAPCPSDASVQGSGPAPGSPHGPVGRMNWTWGIYTIRGRLAGGAETAAQDRKAVSYFIRWRVNGSMRRRSFETRGYAATFRDELLKAKLLGWEADDKGLPIDPSRPAPAAPSGPSATGSATRPGSHTLETYVNQVWWPTIRTTLEDKNRLGHKRNADVAVRLLRLAPDDPRIATGLGQSGDSIALADLTSDDIRAALVARRGINGRTAAVNQRRLEKALAATDDSKVADLVTEPEIASPATVRAFYITLSMIIKAAIASGQVVGNPMQGTASFAPKPRPSTMSQRLVPSIDELFDLADAIAGLGLLMPDGRPCGARFRSLVLCAGTTGPRPGELVAHRPDWFAWHADAPEIAFRKTEAAVYGRDLAQAESGRRERHLKNRNEDHYRSVPLLQDVADAVVEHIERGYSSTERTWLSQTGQAHLDWAVIRDTFWRPALRAVFAGTAKASLVDATPKILRKTAITWWCENGIMQNQAAEWAGHSEEVATIYYASRSRTTYAREIALLARSRER